MYYGTKFLFRCLLFVSFSWFFLKCLLPFLLPFLLGTLLALTAEPIVKRLCRSWHFPRALSSGIGVSFSFLLLACGLLGLLTVIFQVLSGIADILPGLWDTVLSGLSLLEQWLLALSRRAPGSMGSLLQQHVTYLFSNGTAFLGQGVRYILSLAGGLLTHIPDQAVTFFTAIVSGFMISGKLPGIRRLLKQKLSREKLQPLLSFLRKLRETAGRWLLAQLKLAGVTALILTLGLILLRIPYAPIWAVSISLLDAMPLLGTGIFLIPWSLISLLKGKTVQALGLAALYVAAALIRSLLEPRFVGKQLGLDPLITLAAMYGGYRLFGIGGMIFSPLLAVTAFGFLNSPADSGK